MIGAKSSGQNIVYCIHYSINLRGFGFSTPYCTIRGSISQLLILQNIEGPNRLRDVHARYSTKGTSKKGFTSYKIPDIWRATTENGIPLPLRPSYKRSYSYSHGTCAIYLWGVRIYRCRRTLCVQYQCCIVLTTSNYQPLLCIYPNLVSHALPTVHSETPCKSKEFL